MKPRTVLRYSQLSLALAGAFGLVYSASGANTDIHYQPLSEAAAGVKPNVMFILDDSGSMDWDYSPDYVDDVQPSGSTPSTTAACFDGGDTGPAIVAGKPNDSILIKRIESGDMPPPKDGKLDKQHVELLRRWVLAGAPALNVNKPSSSEEAIARISDDERNFWAFQAPKRPATPRVAGGRRVRSCETVPDALHTGRTTFRGEIVPPLDTGAVLLRLVPIPVPRLFRLYSRQLHVDI